MNAPLEPIIRQFADHSHSNFSLQSSQEAHGGSINRAYVVETNDQQRFFIKLNKASRLEMFAAEAEGLAEISKSNTLRVPEPLFRGTEGNYAFLILEYLEIGGSASAHAEEQMGRQLAQMHQTFAAQHGWYRDNTIGSTPQYNTQHANWTEFWREQRLVPQLRWAKENGASHNLLDGGERLLADLDRILQGHSPKPALLHGDLWGGNWAAISTGEPVIFDPATYYGDPEADLAMTYLFGGFARRFYDAYHEILPPQPGIEQRKTLYNLYHVLNHFNMFGGSYAMQAEHMIQQLV